MQFNTHPESETKPEQTHKSRNQICAGCAHFKSVHGYETSLLYTCMSYRNLHATVYIVTTISISVSISSFPISRFSFPRSYFQYNPPARTLTILRQLAMRVRVYMCGGSPPIRSQTPSMPRVIQKKLCEEDGSCDWQRLTSLGRFLSADVFMDL